MTQSPGNLPDGCTLDSMLTLEQASVWLQMKSLKRQARRLPGISGTKHNRRLHPRTYLELTMKGNKR